MLTMLPFLHSILVLLKGQTLDPAKNTLYTYTPLYNINIVDIEVDIPHTD